MKAIVQKVDKFTTTVVTVLCPVCGHLTIYNYPFDEGFLYTEREEPCEECETILEFTYGDK